MQDYRYLRLVTERGAGIAGLAAAGVFAAILAVALGIESRVVWVAIALGAACLTGFLILVVRDIARVIAETLVPAP